MKALGNAIRAIRIHVADLLAATRSIIAPIAAQCARFDVHVQAEHLRLFGEILETLRMHERELAEHLRRLGGEAAADERPTENLATGLLGVAGDALARKRSFGRAIRDDYAAISLAHAGALMLETNARVLGFSSTAALATRHREELASMLREIAEVLPGAIKEEVAMSAQAFDERSA